MKDFKEDDIIINNYNEIWKVLMINNIDFICRRLSDNKVDSLTKSHFKLYKCKHENITSSDGCDECLDCGVRNY